MESNIEDASVSASLASTTQATGTSDPVEEAGTAVDVQFSSTTAPAARGIDGIVYQRRSRHVSRCEKPVSESEGSSMGGVSSS